MTFELREIVQLNLNTIRKPKFEIFDSHGSTTFSISAVTYSLKNSKTAQEVLSGPAAANNADEDVAGNTIKTVQATLDLTGTDIEIGNYMLSFGITLTNGETDVLRVPIEVVDFSGA